MKVPIFLLGVVLLVLCVNAQFFPPQQSQPQTAQFSLQLNLPYSGHPNTQQLANTWFSLMISQQFQLPIGSVVVIGSQPLPGNIAQSIIFTVSLPAEQLPSVTAGLMGTYSGLIQQQPVSPPSSALPFVGGQIFSATDADDQTSNSELDEVNLAEFDEALSSLDEEAEASSASVDEAGAESFSALSADSQLALNPQQYVPNPQYSPLYVPPYQANLPGYTQPRPLYDPSQPPGTPQTATQQIYGPPNYTPYNPYVNVNPTNPNTNNPNPNNPNVPYNPNAPFNPNAPVQGVSTGPAGWSSAAVMANNGGNGNLTVDSKWLIIGCSAGGGVLFLMLLIYCIFVRKRFKKDITDDNFTRHHIDSISIRDNFVYNPAVEIEGQTTVKKDKNWDKYY